MAVYRSQQHVFRLFAALESPFLIGLHPAIRGIMVVFVSHFDSLSTLSTLSFAYASRCTSCHWAIDDAQNYGTRP